MKMDRSKKQAAEVQARELQARKAEANYDKEFKKWMRKFQTIEERGKELKTHYAALRLEQTASDEKHNNNVQKESHQNAWKKYLTLKNIGLKDGIKAWTETEEAGESFKDVFAEPEDRLVLLVQRLYQNKILVKDLDRKLALCKAKAKDDHAVTKRARTVRVDRGAIIKAGTLQQKSVGKNGNRQFRAGSEGKPLPAVNEIGSQAVSPESEKEQPTPAASLTLIQAERLNEMCGEATPVTDKQAKDARCTLDSKNEDAQKQHEKQAEIEALSREERAKVSEEGKAQNRLAKEDKKAVLEEKPMQMARLAREKEERTKQKVQQEKQQEKDMHAPLEPGTQDCPEECGYHMNRSGANTHNQKEQMRTQGDNRTNEWSAKHKDASRGEVGKKNKRKQDGRGADERPSKHSKDTWMATRCGRTVRAPNLEIQDDSRV